MNDNHRHNITCHGIEMRRLPTPKMFSFKTGQWEERDRTPYDLRAQKFDGTPDNVYEEGGVLYWKSNGHPVPVSVLRDDACLEPTSEQVSADDAFTRKFISEYRNNPPKWSAETLAEIESEFGPDAPVDLITGKRISR